MNSNKAKCRPPKPTKNAGLSNEDLKWVLDRTSAYIRDADTKNAFVVALLSVVVTITLSDGEFLTKINQMIKEGCPYCCVVFLLGLASSLTVITVLGSVFPRLDSKEARCSNIYYGDISSFDSASEYLDSVDRCSLRSELINQILVNSKIAKKKMALNRYSIISLLVFIAMLALVQIFGGVN